MAIKRAVKPHILYYFLIEVEPLDIHYQAEPGNEYLLLSLPSRSLRLRGSLNLRT